MSGQSATPSLEHTWQPSVNPWIIAFVVMLATFMEVLDTSVANVSLPHIAGNLSAGVDESTWVLTSYLVSNAIVLPLSGWFSMIFGRKRFYIGCVILFTISSLLCGLAPNLESLVVFRILQGIGGGALQPVSQAILWESFPKHKQGMAMAVYGIGVVFAPIVGPTLGGWITDNFSWRWIFLINIPVGVLSVMLTMALVEDPPYLVRKRLRDVRIDYMGLGLLSLGLGFLEIMLDKGEREDWFDSNFIRVSALIAVVSLVLLVWWELRQKEPVIELHLLKNRNYALSVLIMFVLGVVLYASTMLLPLFLQTLMGYTAMLSGLVISPGGFGVMLLMPLVGWWLSRYQPRWLIMIGLLVSALGLFQMSRFNLQIDFWTAMWARVVQAAGLAFLFVPINTAAFAFISRAKTGAATGLINLARNVGGSCGIALTTTLLAQRTQFHQNVLSSHLTPYDPAFQSTLHQAAQALIGRGVEPTLANQQSYAIVYGLLQKNSSMLAFNDCFLVMAFCFLAMIPLVLLLKEGHGTRGPAAAH